MDVEELDLRLHQVAALQKDIDDEHNKHFSNLVVKLDNDEERVFEAVDEKLFGQLGRTEPQVRRVLF